MKAYVVVGTDMVVYFRDLKETQEIKGAANNSSFSIFKSMTESAAIVMFVEAEKLSDEYIYFYNRRIQSKPPASPEVLT